MAACLCADVTEEGTDHLEHMQSSCGPKPLSEHSVSFCKRQVVSEVEPTQERLRAHRDVPDKAKGGKVQGACALSHGDSHLGRQCPCVLLGVCPSYKFHR